MRIRLWVCAGMLARGLVGLGLRHLRKGVLAVTEAVIWSDRLLRVEPGLASAAA